MVLDAVPAAAGLVLDVGCGEGLLTVALADQVAGHGGRVIGLDLDEPTVAVAARAAANANLEYAVGDVLTHPLEPGSFDAVVSVAVAHHIGTERALRRMGELVRPGGVVAAVGLARSELPRDLPRELAAAVGTRLHRLTKPYWETSAPKVWPPDVTYRDVRAIAARVLPGSHFRRHLLWRWSVVWRRPAT